MSQGVPPSFASFTPGSGRAQIAATWVWAVGGIEVALFGCCAGCFVVGAMLPNSYYVGAPVPPGMTLDLLRVAMGILGVIVTLVLVLPGVALLALGFGVRKGRNGPRQAARVIFITQAALVSGMVVLNLVASAMSGQLVGAILQATLMGGLVALQLFAAKALTGPLVASGAIAPGGGFGKGDDFDEPWNAHLR